MKALIKILKMPKKFISVLYRAFKQNKYLKWYYKLPLNEKSVLIESKHGDDLAGNMFYILKEIYFNHTEYKITLVISRQGKKRIKKILATNSIENINFAYFGKVKYLKLLTTAKYLFTDTSFSIDYIKKQGQVYTNTWHGTPYKMMGKHVQNRAYAIGNLKRNFLMADYLVYPSYEMREKMMSAYGLDYTFRGEVLNCGYPRNSIFFDKAKALEVKERYNLTDKKVYVYMPTWRGILTDRKADEQKADILNKMRTIDSLLSDDQVLYVKMHVLVSRNLNFSSYKHIRVFPSDIEAYEFLNCADTLITDYSSVFFDYANSGKKIILYTYDEEEFLKDRGFYYDINDFPFPRVKIEEELVAELNNPEISDYTEFLSKFCGYDYKDCPKDLVNYVLKGIKSNGFEVYDSDYGKKERILIYTAALRDETVLKRLLSFCEKIDKEKYYVDFSFRMKDMKRTPENTDLAPDFVDFFPICSGLNYTFKELFSYILFYKFNVSSKSVLKTLDKLYKREIIRYFARVDYKAVIQFIGNEKNIVSLFERFDTKKIILVQNNVLEELKTTKKQHKATLISAYKNYDKVIAVNKSAFDSAVKLTNVGEIVLADDLSDVLLKEI